MTRPYRKRRRAELEEETRRRITQATMELHELVGPAQTTVSAIAERAGVQRATVYRHFPDDTALITACSAHWMMLNPAPDIAAWAAIGDVDERLRTALAELYAWYERTETMVELLNRDRGSVPALDERLRLRDAYFAAALETLLRGRPERGGRRRRARGAIAHALEFETWRSLVRHQGLAQSEAVELLARLVAAA
ncbi:MAG TPA: helix-turn-helix domain-containing protein [Solirubrobacterales bacterium]|nr:helix-turn-helix domain-containing protein [Solirubrobacterales bacterium]